MDFGATQSHFLIGSVMLVKVELGAPRTEEAGNGLRAWPQLAPLSAAQGGGCISSQLWLVTTLQHCIGTSCLLRNGSLPTPGTLPPAHSGSASSVSRQAPLAGWAGLLQMLGSDFPKGLSLCSSDCPDLSVFM